MPIRQLDRAAIRREARELIRTARVSPIKFTLLFLAVSLALSLLDTALTSLTGRIVGVAFVSVSFASILIGLITQVLDAGYKCYCLGVHRREEMPYESLFDGFTFAGKVIALYIVEGFFVALWSMLFVISGIIAVYRYSFAIWNLCQNPELGVMEALNRSKRQTIGYKGQLFGLHLSFIGWYLIVFVIVGVYEGVILALMPDSFLGIMLGSLNPHGAHWSRGHLPHALLRPLGMRVLPARHRAGGAAAAGLQQLHAGVLKNHLQAV